MFLVAFLGEGLWSFAQCFYPLFIFSCIFLDETQDATTYNLLNKCLENISFVTNLFLETYCVP